MLEKIAARIGAKKLAPLIAGKKTYVLLAAAAAVILQSLVGGDTTVATEALSNPGGVNHQELLILLITGALATMKAGANRTAKEVERKLDEQKTPMAITTGQLMRNRRARK